MGALRGALGCGPGASQCPAAGVPSGPQLPAPPLHCLGISWLFIWGSWTSDNNSSHRMDEGSRERERRAEQVSRGLADFVPRHLGAEPTAPSEEQDCGAELGWREYSAPPGQEDSEGHPGMALCPAPPSGWQVLPFPEEMTEEPRGGCWRDQDRQTTSP